MTRRGPKPKPTNLKVVSGTDRPTRHVDEFEIEQGDFPEAPEHLDSIALAEWNRVIEGLYYANIITEIDTAGLEFYCVSYSIYVRSQKKAKEIFESDPHTLGLLGKGKNGPIRNPYLREARSAMSDCLKYASEYGLTPSARLRLAMERKDGNEVAKKYFG